MLAFCYLSFRLVLEFTKITIIPVKPFKKDSDIFPVSPLKKEERTVSPLLLHIH